MIKRTLKLNYMIFLPTAKFTIFCGDFRLVFQFAIVSGFRGQIISRWMKYN
jgi:hypothetical protein